MKYNSAARKAAIDAVEANGMDDGTISAPELVDAILSAYSDALSDMTAPAYAEIEALTTALGALVDNDISYNDRDLVIRCANSGEAMHKVFEARAILAKVRG